MRRGRLTETGEAYYHAMSRVVDRQFVLNNDEKERFRKLLRRVEGFSGVDVLTFCVLDTHFHALLHVPEREDISDVEWIKRVKRLYTRQQALDIVGQYTRLREQGHEAAARQYRQQFTDRMYDLGEFMSQTPPLRGRRSNSALRSPTTAGMDAKAPSGKSGTKASSSRAARMHFPP
jgi:REP element-mobilizing transposase RayT